MRSAVYTGLLLLSAAACAQQPGARTVPDAHNCYPYGGRWSNRIDVALAAGLPVAIEQDLHWYEPGGGTPPRSVLSHDPPSGSEPGMEQYFFERVRPLVEAALKNPDRSQWPLITLNLDFKSNAPEHLRAAWRLLEKYRDWLTTAVKTGDGRPQPLAYGPILVLNGIAGEQQKVFYDDVPAGARLLTFGAVRPDEEGASNYRRWRQLSWRSIEPEGQPKAGPWTPEKQKRLEAIVDRAHSQGLWIRFYCLDGVSQSELAERGIFETYNFPSPEAARRRWDAAIAAGVDYLASDQYAELGQFIRERARSPRAAAPSDR